MLEWHTIILSQLCRCVDYSNILINQCVWTIPCCKLNINELSDVALYHRQMDRHKYNLLQVVYVVFYGQQCMNTSLIESFNGNISVYSCRLHSRKDCNVQYVLRETLTCFTIIWVALVFIVLNIHDSDYNSNTNC